MSQRPYRYVDAKRLLLALPVLLIVGAGVYWVRAQSQPSSSTPRAALVDTPNAFDADVGVRRNELARDFTGTAPDGKTTRLSDLRGRPTIVNFWATWCSSCLTELPDFKRVQQEIGVDELYVVAVNTGEDASDARRFVNELELDTFHIVLDPSLAVTDAYGVSGMPTTLFLDADGFVRATYVGHLSADQMLNYVAAAGDARDGGEPPSKLRLITTVAREHTLEVDTASENVVELGSKSLRCDESYCAAATVDAFERTPGVTAIERRLSDDPPAIIVEFEPGVTDPNRLAGALAAQLNAVGDPLYERPLEIIDRDKD